MVLNCRIKTPAKKLYVGGNSTFAAAIQNPNVVYSVIVKDAKVGMARDGATAAHADVVELHFKTKRSQVRPLEVSTSPLLNENLSKSALPRIMEITSIQCKGRVRCR